MDPRTRGAGRPSRGVRTAGAVLAGCLLSAAIPAATAQAQQIRVMALHAARREAPGPVIADDVLQRRLRQRLHTGLDYYTESLDVARFPDPDFQQATADFLKRKYAGLAFDVLIATSDQPLEFLAAYGDELFAGVPVVFNTTAKVTPRPRSTGVTTTFDMASTLTMVAQLQPATRRVFVPSGSSALDRFYENLARAQLQQFEGRFEFTYAPGLSMAALVEQVGTLPPDSIVYPLMITEDGDGERFLPFDSHDRIVAAANVPVYVWAMPTMGRGAVGGRMFSPEVVATHLADLALRVLGGENPEDIPVAAIDATVSEVDWRQLQRWGISEARVPAGTSVRFREPTAWDRYRPYIVGTTALLLAQTALIGGLLVQRAKRRRVEGALRESEERFRVSAQQNQDLAGRLITAQEAERARIARELHDDMSQQLAGLSILLSGLRKRLNTRGSGPDIDETLRTLEQRTAGLADGIRDLSHELHSGILQHVGLPAALREYCAEFTRRHGVTVEFSTSGTMGPVDPDVGLCVYRVAQEALTNIARHARAGTAHVRLARSDDGLALDVVDDGNGFDTSAVASGLGLRSIGERVRLVNGTVGIQSKAGQGTHVVVRIPLSDPASDTGSAAGLDVKAS